MSAGLGSLGGLPSFDLGHEHLLLEDQLLEIHLLFVWVWQQSVYYNSVRLAHTWCFLVMIAHRIGLHGRLQSAPYVIRQLAILPLL